MAPNAITPFETTSALTSSGIKHSVIKKAPSVFINGNAAPSSKELDSSKLVFTRNPSPHIVPMPDSPEVRTQAICTEHTATCQWTSTSGWAVPHHKSYGPVQVMPIASVLHYATECFEGLNFTAVMTSNFAFFDQTATPNVRSTVPLAYPLRGLTLMSCRSPSSHLLQRTVRNGHQRGDQIHLYT